MSSQQQQSQQHQQQQQQQQQTQQRQPSVEKQSENYGTDKQIIDIIAKLKGNTTMSIEEKLFLEKKEKNKMANSLIEAKLKNKSKYIKTMKQDGKTYYYLDLSGGKDTPTDVVVVYDTMAQAEEAFNQVITDHAKKVTKETFKRCKGELENTPAYLTNLELQNKKEEIDKQEAELKFQQTQLVAQKQSLDEEITKTTAKLVTHIDMFYKLNKQESQMATTKAQMAQADLNAAIKDQNDKNLVKAQQATTEAITEAGKSMKQAISETHDKTMAANVQNRDAITSAIGETGRLIQSSAEDAKKAAENAANAINSTLQALSQDSKKAAADAMTAAAEANKLSEKQLAKQEETKAAVTAMNEAVVAASDKAEYSATMLRSEIEKVGSELIDIKELLGNKLDTLAEAFKTDKTVEITPDVLDGILDEFLQCSSGFSWRLIKHSNPPLGYSLAGTNGVETDRYTTQQLKESIHGRYNPLYFPKKSYDYLHCDGGTHYMCLYDFNDMLKMNGLPQIDWSDPKRTNGVFSRFGVVADQPYKT